MQKKQSYILLIFWNMVNKILQKEELNSMKDITDEESVIAYILAEMKNTITFPLFDIWGGSWKIASLAYPEESVVHIDPLYFSEEDFPLSENHTRVQTDFFEFDPQTQCGSLLFCHSLQYLDDRWVDALNAKILTLNPKDIIVVINQNTGVLGEMLKLFEAQWWKENGERHHADFPPQGYVELQRTPLIGTFYPKDIEESVATLVRLLLDTHIHDEQISEIKQLIKNYQASNHFTVEQWIVHYQKSPILQ